MTTNNSNNPSNPMKISGNPSWYNPKSPDFNTPFFKFFDKLNDAFTYVMDAITDNRIVSNILNTVLTLESKILKYNPEWFKNFERGFLGRSVFMKRKKAVLEEKKELFRYEDRS